MFLRISDVSVAHQRESLTGAGVEADRRDSLLFHFICNFFVRIRQADDADVRHRVSEEEERERNGERATRVGGCRGERCGRKEKSFNVKVTWAHAHRIDHTLKRDKDGSGHRRKGSDSGGGKGGPASLGRMLSSGDKMHLPAASSRRKYIMPIAYAVARGLLSKHAEFIWM